MSGVCRLLVVAVAVVVPVAVAVAVMEARVPVADGV